MWIKLTTLTEQSFNTIDDISIFLIGLIDFEVVPPYVTRLRTILTRFVLVEDALSDVVSFYTPYRVWPVRDKPCSLDRPQLPDASL